MIWADNLGAELAFWRRWFSDDEFREGRDLRRAALSQPFPPTLARELGVRPGETLRVLDVGSGPLSTLRTRAPENPVELVCVDALAADYNALLDEFGYDECPRIVPGVGERLTEQHGLEAFHLVHIANALDHCEDPARAFVEMCRVCRVGGQVWVVSIENEGERERYSGLHQWNLLAGDATLRLWNSQTDCNLLDLVPGPFDFTWRYVREEPGMRVFSATIHKRDGQAGGVTGTMPCSSGAALR
jgi:SAM-dependent methyltransferase